MCKACKDCEHKNKFFPESVLNICSGINLFDKDSCGFVNPETMQGIFLSVCDEVNHPLVFIQKRNENCNLDKNLANVRNLCIKKYGCDENSCAECRNEQEFYDKYYRLESNIFYSRLSGICKYARKDKSVDGFRCGFQRCLMSDAYAAAYFLDKESLPSKIKIDLKKGYDYDKTNGREYLRYICPTTHYTEVAIPVMVENKTVGVLIFGQMLMEDNESSHKTFFDTISGKYANDEEFEKNKVYFDRTIYNEEGIKTKIKECIESVQKLETRLEDVLKVYRKWYIDEISRELLETFPKIDTMSIPNEGIVSTDIIVEKYKIFKASLYNLAASLCNKMNISQMTCFAPNSLPNAVNCFGMLSDVSTENEFNDQVLKFDFDKFNSLYPTGQDKIVDIDHIKEIIINFNKEADRDKNLSYVLYVTSGDSQGIMPIAVLFGYDTKLMDKDSQNNFIGELDSLIDKIKDPVYVIASAIVNRYMEIEQRRFVQVMRHELGQSHAGYLTLIDQFEQDFASSFERIDNSINHTMRMYSIERAKITADTITKNSLTFAHTVMLRVNGTRYSGGVQNPKMKYFYPYGEFLFKWNYIFSETQKNKHLIFKMPIDDVFLNPSEYPLMYADSDMIEQVAFNLTNNAMKYSHFGSAVTLNCFADRTKNTYILEVINYALPLSNEEIELIFNYGYTGTNHNEKGSGLGLYISREIALRHNGKLEVEQEIVSDYNVPLLQLYKKDMPKYMFSEEMYKEVQTEIQRLKNKKDSGGTSEWSKILGEPIPQNPFTPLYIRENIKKQTARIKFTLAIPLLKVKYGDD